MKRKLCILFSLLFTLSLTAGCGGKESSATESGEKEIQYEAPDLIDLTVKENATFDNMDGCFIETRCDLLEAGYPDWDGEMLTAGDYPALAEVLEQHKYDTLSWQEAEYSHLLETASYGQEEEIYFYHDAYVTRNDTQVVSFYEHISLYDGWMGEYWKTKNIDTKTGKILTAADVFTDPEELPALLTEALIQEDPFLEGAVNLEEIIATSLETGDQDVCFALSYGSVHFFFAEYLLENYFVGDHIVFSLKDYPELVKEPYRLSPESYMLQLEYNTDCLTADGKLLNMSWMMDGEWSESALWNMIVDGNVYTEEFYGFAPQSCYLIHTEGKDYIYLQEPAGDISMVTDIYEITSNGLKKIGNLPLAMHSSVNLNPDRLFMDINDMLYAYDIMLMPYGMYRVGSDGMPVLTENTFGVTGTDMVGKETFRIYMTDPKDASVEEGFTTVAQGIILTPFRTDMETYLDLFTEDGRAIRLTIDGWYDEMEIHGFGTLNDGFEASMYHPYE